MFGLWRLRRTLEQMIAELAACGVTFCDPGTMSQLSRQAIEKGGFESLLIEMGDEVIVDNEPVRLLSDDVWHFDAECIYDHGDYTTIVEHLCHMTGGEFHPDAVRDFVDVDAGTAWVEWTWQGRTERVVLTVDDDWVDPEVFSRTQAALRAAGSARCFAVQSLGQDALIVCKTPDQLQQLNHVTGLRFEPV